MGIRIFKSILSLIITVVLIYLLDNRWVIGSGAIPPLGKFLDPFHGFWKNLESDDHRFRDSFDIEGLQQPVSVVYDSLMIPHIFASSDEDIFLAQGYVTAMHRLWQMEFQTHAAAGRISEIIGKNDAILNYDRGQRRLGMTYGAMKSVEAMQADPVSKMMVEKYTEGINRYIQTLSYEDLPFEYKLLHYKPEPWTPLKCALLLKNMAQTLNMGDKDIEMTNALKLFGKEFIDVLYPDREPKEDPIVDNPKGWNFKPIILDTVPLALPEELIKIKKMPPSDPTTGSNNWAVHGSKTATGSPILCGDPHLQLNLPSIWYAIQLHTPELNVMGVSLPGAPGVIIGFNDSIAWSVTNAQRDLVDWFKISFKDSKKEQYLLNEKWTNTSKIIEEFKIRGEESFFDTVYYTHWGPVTYDESYHAGDNLKHYAFRWVAHDASNEVLTFFKLNRAKNYDGYMDALNHFTSPAQNFVFASVSGDIAMRVQGKFPVRRKNEGKFVLDGSKLLEGWQAFIPNEQNVMQKNPLRGFVSSANQYPADSTYPYYITAPSFEAYRNRRINQVLREDNSITVKDMMQLQNDTYNLKAAESLPYFLQQLDTTTFDKDQREAYMVFKKWNYFNDKNSEGAAYYEAWWDNLMPLLWDEMQREDLSLSMPTTYNTIKLLKEKPTLTFFDIQLTPEKETAGDVIRKSFTTAVSSITKWKIDHAEDTVKWADYKDSYIGHLIPMLTPLRIPVKSGGNHDIVNAHSKTHGPSWRMIVSLEKTGLKAWAVYPGGESGNPGSLHYSDQIQTWIDGQYFSLLHMHASDEHLEKIYQTIQFKPVTK